MKNWTNALKKQSINSCVFANFNLHYLHNTCPSNLGQKYNAQNGIVEVEATKESKEAELELASKAEPAKKLAYNSELKYDQEVYDEDDILEDDNAIEGSTLMDAQAAQDKLFSVSLISSHLKCLIYF